MKIVFYVLVVVSSYAWATLLKAPKVEVKGLCHIRVEQSTHDDEKNYKNYTVKAKSLLDCKKKSQAYADISQPHLYKTRKVKALFE